MTGLLKNVMTEKADHQVPPNLDLDAIVATGNKRIRRRRTVRGLGVAVLAAGLIAGALTVLPNDEAPVSDAPFVTRKVTWAEDNVIHYGDRDIPLGDHKLSAFVQTDAGFVFTDPAGRVYVADGLRIEQVGAGNKAIRLKADDTGALAGWVDRTTRIPEFVVYDVAARREVARTAAGNVPMVPKPPTSQMEPRVVGIDGGYAYLGASNGVHRLDLTTGRTTMLKRGMPESDFQDVAAGVFGTTRHKPSSHIVVSPDFRSDQPRFEGWYTDISPDGRHLYTESGDTPRVYATGSTTQLPLAHPEHPLIVISQWLDNDRFVAIGIRDDTDKPVMQPIDLVTCSVSTLKCEVSVPKFQPYPKNEAEAGFQLPTGKRLG